MKKRSDLPELLLGNPVSPSEVVRSGYITFDTSFLMASNAESYLNSIAVELDQQNARAWLTADVLCELQIKAKDPHMNNSTRASAKKAYQLVNEMCKSDVLRVFAENSDEEAESKCRAVFADNVIVARLRLYSQETPCVVLTADTNLARMLLTPLPYECSERPFHTKVFTINEDGICPWTLAKESVSSKPHVAHVAPLSLLSAKTTLPNALFPKGTLGKAVTGHEQVYKVGKLLRREAGSRLYSIVGNKEHALRIYDEPSLHLAAKAELLIEKKLNIANIANIELPIDMVTNSTGSFVGTIVPRIEGVLLGSILSEEGRMTYCPDWNRIHFTKTALQVARLTASLHAAGIRLNNLNPNSFVIQKGSDGNLDPESIAVVDVLNSEFGDCEKGLFPGVLHPEYIAPELVDTESPVYGSETTLGFSLLLLVTQLVLGGTHPFGWANDGQSITERIAVKAFPFCPGKKAKPADLTPDYLWSHTSRSFKTFVLSVFGQEGNRPKLEAICSQAEHLVSWFEKADEEDRSLTPSGYKAFIIMCKDCGTQFDASKQSRDAKRFEICDACLSKPVGTCSICSNPLEMTRGEMLRRDIPAPMTCKACGARKKPTPAKVPAPVKRSVSSSFAICPTCGHAYSTLMDCTVCTTSKASKTLTSEGSDASKIQTVAKRRSRPKITSQTAPQENPLPDIQATPEPPATILTIPSTEDVASVRRRRRPPLINMN